MKHHIAPKSHCHFLLPLPRRTNFDFSSQHTVSQTADARTFAEKNVFLLLLGKSSNDDDSETLIFSLRKVGRCHFLRLPFSEEGEGNEFLSPQKKIFHSLPRKRRRRKKKNEMWWACGARTRARNFLDAAQKKEEKNFTVFYRSFFAPFPSPYLGGRETISPPPSLFPCWPRIYHL